MDQKISKSHNTPLLCQVEWDAKRPPGKHGLPVPVAVKVAALSGFDFFKFPLCEAHVLYFEKHLAPRCAGWTLEDLPVEKL